MNSLSLVQWRLHDCLKEYFLENVYDSKYVIVGAVICLMRRSFFETSFEQERDSMSARLPRLDFDWFIYVQ